MPPVVSKADNSNDPVVIMLLQSNIRNSLQITEFANNNLVERIQTIPGVSGVNIWGEKKYAMRIWFNPAKMSAFSLTPKDVQNALLRENVELPAGKISGNATELGIRTFGKLNTEDEFNNLIVKNINGTDIRLKDIGEAVLGPENEESVLKESNVPMIAVAIIPQPGTTSIEISDEIHKRLKEIKADLPADIRLEISSDQTDNIRKSISEVKETLIISFILVVMMCICFSELADCIKALIIPVSLVVPSLSCAWWFPLMYLHCWLLLTTGLVDDGIVVLRIFIKDGQG
jgi:multidrug efflux pump